MGKAAAELRDAVLDLLGQGDGDESVRLGRTLGASVAVVARTCSLRRSELPRRYVDGSCRNSSVGGGKSARSATRNVSTTGAEDEPSSACTTKV